MDELEIVEPVSAHKSRELYMLGAAVLFIKRSPEYEQSRMYRYMRQIDKVKMMEHRALLGGGFSTYDADVVFINNDDDLNAELVISKLIGRNPRLAFPMTELWMDTLMYFPFSQSIEGLHSSYDCITYYSAGAMNVEGLRYLSKKYKFYTIWVVRYWQDERMFNPKPWLPALRNDKCITLYKEIDQGELISQGSSNMHPLRLGELIIEGRDIRIDIAELIFSGGVREHPVLGWADTQKQGDKMINKLKKGAGLS